MFQGWANTLYKAMDGLNTNLTIIENVLSEDELKNHNITVRYIPYDIKDN